MIVIYDDDNDDGYSDINVNFYNYDDYHNNDDDVLDDDVVVVLYDVVDDDDDFNVYDGDSYDRNYRSRLILMEPKSS